MKIVVVGGRGQLGRELVPVLEPKHETVVLDLPQCNIVEVSSIYQITALHPELVVHMAAMTDVDRCARDPLAAFAANALGTQNVALACQRAGAPMVYISTNEVFDGTKGSPYLELDEARAINPYGASKLAGERYVQLLLARFYIVRTAWLFSPGGANFPKRIIAAARQNGGLNVTADEIANPTYAPDLSQAIARLIESEHYGIYHLVNEGMVSRYEYARSVLARAGLGGIPLTPIPLAEYKRDSTPPRYGVLANFAAATALGIRLRPWEEALDDFFANLKEAG